MSEIAVRPDHTLDVHDGNDAVAQLARWAQAADAAYQMARKLVTTQFVPQQYRGKPEEATAAILAGAELGFGPMAALRSFHNIQGVPAPAAITLRAVVQSKGHEIRVVESTPQRAVVAGRRAGTDEWQTSTWDIDRARSMGLLEKNPQYKRQPANMLLARATSEVCRWIASDAIMGMPYSAEELRDADGDDLGARPRAVRVTTSEILGQPVSPAPLPAGPDPQWSRPVGPVEPDDEAPAIEPAEPITPAQITKLHTAFTAAGIKDRADKITRIAQVTGRTVESSKDLTKDEARRVIDHLEQPEVEDPPGYDEPNLDQ